MPSKKSASLNFILGNFIPAIHFSSVIYVCLDGRISMSATFVWLVILIYLLPPIVVRGVYLLFGTPNGRFKTSDSQFWIWYFGAQMQVLYLRFRFLEEILRIFPLVYSNWLRLWGAKIGKSVYWSPHVTIMDRTHLEIGDFAILGYGVGFTSHFLNQSTGKKDFELIIAAPKVGANTILGGQSGLAPGSEVAAGETLPATHGLAPFYIWRNGRRYATPIKRE